MRITGIYISYLKITRTLEIIGVLIGNAFIEFYAHTFLGKRMARRAVRKKRKSPPSYAYSTAERMRIVIEELGPTYVKFGQILADRPDIISARFREQLKKLQSHARPFSDAAALNIIIDELSMPIDQVFKEFDPVCMAAASIGQVYNATLLDGSQVIVKVQRPNVEHKIQTDLHLMRYLAKQLAVNYPEMAAVNIVALVDDFADTITRELDYRNEAGNMQRFHEMFREDKSVYIPRVFHKYTTKRLLVMERVEGVTPESAEVLLKADLDPHIVAVNGANALLYMILKHGIFHADPHPGNLFVLKGNVIAFIDFGMVGMLKPRDIEFLAMFALGFARNSSKMVADSLMQLCDIKYFDRMHELEFDLHQMMAINQGLSVSEMDLAKNVQSSINLIIKYKFKIPSGIFMLVKSLTTIQKVGEKLDPGLSLTPIIIPHAKRVLQQQFSMNKIFGDIFETVKDYVRVIRELPGDIGEIMYKMKEGKIRHEIHLEDDEIFVKTFRQMSFRIAYVIVLVGVFIGSSISVVFGEDNGFERKVLYVVTTMIALLLLKWIWKRK